MNKVIFSTFIIFLIYSCNDKDTQTKTNFPLNKIIDIEVDTILLNLNCYAKDSLFKQTELVKRVKKLESLENNYQILEVGSFNLTSSNSILIRGINKGSSYSNYDKLFLINNFDKYQNNIENINYCYIKGTKDLGNKLFARAQIEEFVFKSEECAINLFGFISELKKDDVFWLDVDKSPNSIFRLDNKIFYISAGGHYMMNFYDKIKTKMQE